MKADEARLESLSPIRKALLTIERLQSKLDALERSRQEPIAVIGMGCRFPGGADGPEAFWRLLCEGRDAVTEVPANRFDLSEIYDGGSDAPGKLYMHTGGFLDWVDGFDAPFFRISPREASQMDPQQRLFLEVSWEALENAGQPPDRLVGTRTGVFAGILSEDYAHLPGQLSERIDAYYYPGINGSFVAGRLSYFLGLHGPSIVVDTACSSSLVAVHLACQSLRTGETDMALAGGVNLILSPEVSMFLCKAGAMSPTGRCRAFDKLADGMIRGEGCGVVVLKRLSDAVRAADEVLAIIRGSAANHDGASGGLTVPNPEAQELLYRDAMRNAGVRPHEVSYVEAHGTGTHLGDPIELQGLSAAYCDGRAADQTLWIGSVKTNIGHTDSAAGIANLIKTVLILRNGMIPPTLHFTEPNPQFSWARFPIAVADRLMPLGPSSTPHLAGVTAFGLSGVNAHVILQQAPSAEVEAPPPRPHGDRRACLLPVSAKSPEALRELAVSYRDLLSTGQDDPEDVCAAAATRRSCHDVRLVVVGETRGELVEGLDAFLRNENSTAIATGSCEPDHAPRLAFLFSGQGPQWWAMGRELMAGEAVFREAIERIEEIFSRESGWSILSELTADESRSHIHNTEVAQPAMFAMQVALAELWKHWGVLPDGVVGHSMGEVAAAHAAGVLTLEDAVRVIYHRGRLLERATGRGKMAAANLSYDDARRLVEDSGGGISIAAHNGPSSFVLSGDERAMDRTLAVLNAKGIYCRELHVKFASHCPQMDAYQAEFEAVLEGIRPRIPSVPLLSTVTGRRAASDDFLPSYWARNIREPVLFATTIDGLIDDGFDAFLEIDPHPILGGSISQCLESRGRTGLVLKSLHRETGERRAMLESLATLHVHGHAIDRSVIFGGRARHVALPTYPWQRKRYWLKAGADSRTGTASVSPERGASDRLLGERIESPLEEIQFRSSVRASSPDYLEGHRIAGQVVFPGSAYQVMALSAAEAIDRSATEVRNLTFLAPLILSERWSDLHLVVGPADPRGERAVRVYGRGSATDVPTWTLHAAGIIARVSGKDATAAETPDLEAVRRRCEEGSVDDFYRDVASRGYQYSGSFRCIEAIWKGRDEVLSRLRLPDGPGTGRESRSVHPALLDGCMHSILAAVDFAGADDLFVPIDVGRTRVLSPPGTVAWAHGVMRRCAGDDGDALRADLRVFDSAGRLCVEVTDLSLRHSRSWTLREGGRVPSGGWCYEVAWTPKPIDSFARSTRARGSWILLSDGGPVGASLVRALEATGQDLLLVQTGDRCEAAGSKAWTLDVRDPDNVRSLFRRIRDAEMVCSDVLYVAAAGPADESSSGESIEAGQDALCGGVLHLVQAIEQADLKTTPRLWLITQNAQATGRDEPPLDPRQATLWGLARVIRLEHPGLGCACLDLDARGGGNQSSLVVREIRTNDGETQVAFRRGVRLVARLARHVLPSRAATDSEAPRRVGLSNYGVLDDLALRPMERRPTGPDEVEIRVRVTGLNFRDVLNALGMLEADAREIGIASASEMPFGHECAGEIVTVGRNVAGFRVGDEVIAAMATGSLGSFVTVPAGFVVARPPQLSREEAVTLPVAFLTAYRALHHLAKIRPGDRVLIHCAAGGVGQAAVQLARRAGARVFATASPGKWEFVRSLGVERVMNSRSVDFAAELMQATAGAGVDVVLNSLSGEFISKSFDVCAPGARFVEIGRIDILGEGEAREKRPDVAYFPLALPDVARTDPALIGSMLREMVRLASERELTPLPRTTFPIGSVVDAFRFMAQGKHIGKVVVTQADDGGGRADRRIRGDATYLISGGLGALGLRVARWLVGRGARNLILVGRRGPAGTAAEEIRDLERDGVRVVVALADVSRRDDVDRVLGEVASGMPPLRGVFHAAVVLDDGVLMQQNLERFHKVLAAKVAGAWNLHVLTQDLPLDHFVCFSSAVALLGSPGQGNYAAANAFLDALAHHRRSRGLSGLSVNWGPWAESGLAAGLSARDQARWATRGLEAIPPDQGLEVLGRLLAGSAAQVAVLPVDWSKYLAQLSAPWSFLDDLSPASGAPKDETPDLLRELERTPAAERREMLAAHVRHQVARVLGLTSPETIKLRQRLFDFGLDSLMALELRNRLARSVGRPLRSTLVFDYPTVEALVEHLAENILSRETDSEVSGEPTGEGAAGTRASDLLDQLSGDELADLLAGELSNRSEGDTQ